MLAPELTCGQVTVTLSPPAPACLGHLCPSSCAQVAVEGEGPSPGQGPHVRQ